MYTTKPDWLKIRVKNSNNIKQVELLLKDLSLNTVCEQASCPNMLECFGKKTAAFMILGNICTRNCKFCNVEKGKAAEVDGLEPQNIARAVTMLKLGHVVITSVTRDDLEDGGASHFVKVITEIRTLCKNISIEVLIPDFKGNIESLTKIVAAKPEIINHNLETVSRLYAEVRCGASYKRSLNLLRTVKELDSTIITKSGIMVGLGEREAEIIQVFRDLRKADCDLLTIGQYLAPTKKHYPVKEFIHPDIFKKYKKIGLEYGFKYVAAAPFVRSSYNARDVFIKSNCFN